MSDRPGRAQASSNIPIPDPSLITAQEIAKAKTELRDEFKQLITGLRDVLETRLLEFDKAKGLWAEEIKARQLITDTQLADLKAVQNANDSVVDQRAQAANDALERLLRSSIDATTSISDVRHEATQLAITKVESQLTSAFVASKAAIDAALTTANSAVGAVDNKSHMRCETNEKQIQAVEAKLTDRIIALKQLIDLGTEMSKEAITKAENASEKRFAGLNELRGAMADQAAAYLPRTEADARFNANTEKLDQLGNVVAMVQLDMKTMMRRDDLRPITDDITKLRDVAATSGGKNQVWGIVGGGALSILALLIALFGPFKNNPKPDNPLVSADTARLTDFITQNNEQNRILNSRLDALSARMAGTPLPPRP